MKINEYKFPWIITYLILTITYTISCYAISTNSVMVYKIEMWNWGGEFITFFLPLIAVLPISHIFLGKIKNGFKLYANMRKKNFIKKEIIKSMVTSSTSIFASYFTTFLIVMFFIQIKSPWSSSELSNNIFGDMQVNYPIIFAFLWSLWIGFVSSLFVLLNCTLSLFIKNYFLITLAPFVYLQAENLFTSVLAIPKFSLMTSIHLNRLNPSVMTSFHYMVGVLIFIVVIFIIFVILKILRCVIYD